MPLRTSPLRSVMIFPILSAVLRGVMEYPLVHSLLRFAERVLVEPFVGSKFNHRINDLIRCRSGDATYSHALLQRQFVLFHELLKVGICLWIECGHVSVDFRVLNEKKEEWQHDRYDA